MKFVCDRCQTRYSIADEKVRQKILKIRCKTCDNVITVRDSAEPSGSATSARVSATAAPAARTTGTNLPAARSSASMPAVGARPPSSPGGGGLGTGSVSRASLPRPPTPPAPAPARPDPGPVEWHVAIDGSDEGPFNRVDLVRRILTQRSGAEIYIWKDGFDGWKEPKDVPDVQREMTAQRLRSSSALPPPPAKRPGNGLPGAPNGRPVPLSALADAKAERNAAKAAAHADTGFEEDAESTQIQTLDAALVAESMPPGRSTGARPAVDAKSGDPSGALPPIGGAGTGLEGLDLGRPATPPPGSPYASPYVPPPAGSLAAGASSAASSVPSESALMRVVGGGVFARNPAMKYVVAAGGVVVLVLVVVIASIGRSGDVKPPARDEHASATTPGSPRPAEDPEAEARRKAEAWFGKTGQEPQGSPTSKAVVGGSGRPSLIRRLIGRGGADKTNANAPGATTPPPVGVEPPPVGATNEVAESRKLTGALGDRGERVARPVGPAAPSGGGEVSQERLSAVVTNRVNQDAIKSCYNRALRHDGANMKGRLDVTVSIGASGKVKNVSLASGPELQTVHGCVKTAISRWVFPASRDEYAFGFPLILQGS